MHEINELYLKRSVIGAKLEQIMEVRKINKIELSKMSNVSRPTIDKILSGMIKNETNYEKHITKIIKALDLTPNMILGNTFNKDCKVRVIKSAMNISNESIAEKTKINLERLREIESGAEATIWELRAIAMCCSVGTKDILGKNYFETQVANTDEALYLDEDNEHIRLSRYWGLVGILLINRKKYLWFPITESTHMKILKMLDNDFIVIPCLNNKVLTLNMQNVKEIVFLDEQAEYDANEDITQDTEGYVDRGKYPLVIYENLNDIDGGYLKEYEDYIKNIIKVHGLESEKGTDTNGDLYDEDKLTKFCLDSKLYFKDGESKTIAIDFTMKESISKLIMDIYECTNFTLDIKRIYYTDEVTKTEKYINLQHISMIVTPLLLIEDAIIKKINQLKMK